MPFIDQHDLVATAAFVNEDVFQSAEVAHLREGRADFFYQLPTDGFLAALAEFDRSTQRAVEGFSLLAVAAFGYQNAVAFAADADGDGADLFCMNRTSPPAPLPRGEGSCLHGPWPGPRHGDGQDLAEQVFFRFDED